MATIEMAEAVFALPSYFPVPHGSSSTRLIGPLPPELAASYLEAEVPSELVRGWVQILFHQAAVPDVQLRAMEMVFQDWAQQQRTSGGTQAGAERDVGPETDTSPDAQTRRPRTVTVADGMTPYLPLEERPDGMPLMDACIERLVAEVSRLVDAYSVTSAHHFVVPVSLRTIPMMMFVRRFDLDTGATTWGPAIHLVPGRMPLEWPPMSQEQFEEVLSFRALDEMMATPTWHSARLLVSARRAAHFYGEPDLAVVQAQTSVELTVNTCLRLMLVEERLPVQRREAILSAPFRNRIVEHFATRLGGDWNLEGDGRVGNWWKRLYLVRNQIAHRGTRVTDREAGLALAAAFDLADFIGERLVASLPRFRLAAVMKLAQPGLDKAGVNTPELQRFVNRVIALPVPWWEHVEQLFVPQD